jgi:hypothetical protein
MKDFPRPRLFTADNTIQNKRVKSISFFIRYETYDTEKLEEVRAYSFGLHFLKFTFTLIIFLSQ